MKTTLGTVTIGLALALALGVFSLAGTALAADPPAADKPAAEATAAAKLPARSTIEWDKMDLAARKKYMKTAVLPNMKKLFVAVDKHYKTMSCATCHGSKAAETKFKMPNPELPKLPVPTDRAGFMALQQKKPDIVKFMGTEVKPSMANLLNLAEGSPANPKGFGCYDCHTQQAAPAAGAAPGAAAPAPGAAPAAGKPAAPAAGKPAGGGW